MGMAGFAFCAHRPTLIVPRITGLVAAFAGLAWGMAEEADWCRLLGAKRFPRYRLWYVPLCIALGGLLAVCYRLVQNQPPIPGKLTWFCLIAVGIGAGEEMAYRGFVQGCFRGWGVLPASLIAAGLHAGYKCCLFAFPVADVHANLWWLGGLTLLVGLLFGLMRETFGSVLFPLLAHVSFDAVAYGDLTAAPWWV